MRRRRARRSTSIALTIGLTAGLGLAAGGQAGAEDTRTHAGEVTFAANRYVPRATIPYGAGASGVLYRQEGHDGLLWTSWEGETKKVAVPDPSPVMTQAAAYALTNPKWLPAGSDTMITSVGGELRGTDLAGGETSPFVLPLGHAAVTWAGRHVVTRTGTAGDYTFHLAEWNGGETAAVRATVALPAGAEISASAAADDATLVVRYRGANGDARLGLVDFATGGFTDVPGASGAPVKQVVLTADRVVWLAADASWVPRSRPTAEPTVIGLKPEANERPVIGAAGSTLLVAWYAPTNWSGDLADESGLRLEAMPFTGGAPVALARHASSATVGAPDGGQVVVTGTDSGHWALRKISAEALTTSVVTPVAPVAARVARLSLANGVMVTRETDSMFLPSIFGRTVTATAAGLAVGGPEYKDWAYADEDGGPWSSGDGHLIDAMGGSAETDVASLDRDDDPRWFRMNSGMGSLVDLTGRYVILNGVNPALQYIGDLGKYDTEPLSRPIRAASVWGTKLWSATGNAGVLTAQDLKTLKITTTIRTGAPCVAKELQAVGRWIYWSCGPTGQAGVWDLMAGKNISVPQGETLIGDGYLVQHDRAAGKLRLTGFRDGTANDTHDIGDLPGSAENKRGVTWTIDKFGGPVAYLGADQRMHLVPSEVPKQPVAPIESEVSAGAVVGGEAWKARWLMSRPVASWQIVIRNKATGKVVRTLAGSPNAGGGSVATSWNGRTDTGGYPPNGAYTWTLSAKPADGDAAAASASGTLRVTGGAAVPRDFVKRDGIGDLLAFTSAGVADFRAGTGTGLVDAKVSGSGWTGANNVTAAVPFDDVNGDRCNDVLVRVKSGELRAYKPSCGGALKPTTAYTKVGLGWNIYDALTSPGDLTGDGRADVIARETSTGYLYLYERASTGVFKARVKIGTGWKGYLLAGAGDLNGDGKGDLLARDKAGVLWRYAGTGKGTLVARVKVGAGWQVYNALVGVGDVSGDGKADLLARDTAGVLWAYRGDGKGLFGYRTKVGGGWQMYSRLS